MKYFVSRQPVEERKIAQNKKKKQKNKDINLSPSPSCCFFYLTKKNPHYKTISVDCFECMSEYILMK